MHKDIAISCLQALNEDKIVLCPTDGLPGLSFHPNSVLAQKRIERLKGRSAEKKYLGLCHSLSSAERYWTPLPHEFRQKLARHWPGPLTVIWRASSEAPASLCSGKFQNATIALRVVHLEAERQWFNELLFKLNFPLPSTSVNVSGEPPIRHWLEACIFLRMRLKENEYFIPDEGSQEQEGVSSNPQFSGRVLQGDSLQSTYGSPLAQRQGNSDYSLTQPSTIISLHDDGTFTLIRKGAFAPELL